MRHFVAKIQHMRHFVAKFSTYALFCRENFNIRAPGMKFWSILAQFTLEKYRENITIILHQMKYR